MKKMTVAALLLASTLSGCSLIDHNLPIKGIPVQFPGPPDTPLGPGSLACKQPTPPPLPAYCSQ